MQTRYCLKCGETVSHGGWILKDNYPTGKITRVYYCENEDCPRYGIVQILGLSSLEEAKKIRRKLVFE